MDERDRWMRRALALAAEVPFTSPNPKVGAVLVRDGVLIGEGAHRGSGTPHAETVALAGVDARGATIYVTLEPCAHHGRTPPCTEAIVEAGVIKVVCALADPDPRVSGRGLAHLEAHGIEVQTGLLEEECRRINAPYLHHRRTGRPWVTVKLALSLDGRAGAPDGTSRWITGPDARRRVHRRRSEVDAVMVGAGSVVTDDPYLTVRDVTPTRQPARVVVDAQGRIPASARVFGDGEVLVATTPSTSHSIQTAWKEAGAEVMVLSEVERGVDLAELIGALGTKGWLEVYCEGGPALASSLIADELVQRLDLFYGPILIGNGPALGDFDVQTMSDAQRWGLVSTERLGEDVLISLERVPGENN